MARKRMITRTVEQTTAQVIKLDVTTAEDEYTNEDTNGELSVVEIYWKDLTAEKQQEILNVFGDNCNYDIFPIIQIPANDNGL